MRTALTSSMVLRSGKLEAANRMQKITKADPDLVQDSMRFDLVLVLSPKLPLSCILMGWDCQLVVRMEAWESVQKCQLEQYNGSLYKRS